MLPTFSKQRPAFHLPLKLLPKAVFGSSLGHDQSFEIVQPMTVSKIGLSKQPPSYSLMMALSLQAITWRHPNQPTYGTRTGTKEEEFSMLVMILEAVSPSLRGELSRWLTPVCTGVYVGRVSTLVRDSLWELAVAKAGTGRIVQAWDQRGEPGYGLRAHGLTKSSLVDLEGLPMIAVRDAAWSEAMARFRLMPMYSGETATEGDFSGQNLDKTQ